MKFIGICGSLRAASINLSLLKQAAASLPSGVEMEIVQWGHVPPFNAELLVDGLPDSVTELREKIRKADGVVIATPEYNFSIPGMLKNLLDWLSRGDDQPFAKKPVAILTASPGPVGGARVQYDLRKVLLFMNSMVLSKPEVFVTSAGPKFDASGRCVDESTLKFVQDQMRAFAQWSGDVSKLYS